MTRREYMVWKFGNASSGEYDQEIVDEDGCIEVGADARKGGNC